MRAEHDALFGHLAKIAEAEYLEASGVGEDWVVPRHELLHAAELAHHADAWPQIKVIGVVQQDFDAQFLQYILWNSLNRCDRAHRHEHRRLNFAVRCGEASGARLAVAGFNFEVEGHHSRL